MKPISNRIVLNLVLYSLFFLPNTACAYIDPGTGSMVIQALLAVIATISVSIGIFWRRIRSFFVRLLGREKND